MKIGLLLVEESPAGVQQLIQTVTFKLVENHQVYSIDIGEENEAKIHLYEREQILFSQEFEAPMLRPSQLTNVRDFTWLNEVERLVILGGESANIPTDIKDGSVSYVHIPLVDEETKQSLGYDTALDSIVEQILKVKDTINSMKYDHPRIFGIQLPSGLSEKLIQDVVIAVNEHRMEDISELEGIATSLKESIASGKTYGFILFDENFNPSEVQNS
ncbi:hypothetical protein [Bacillus sp. JCM 19034]|uniref:hypothetical protein n=1 Tax=Bacillus sp. JCM 19034 TaxID=1481928 RepID=UPI0007824853|nr:hypothetical protein [Bacillus sp. JCM 19034]